jgi:CTP:phosphocholine cytidylyltransferase-like protein
MNNNLNSTKLCILAAGTGSRLGYLSESLGKALLPIGNTTALSTIINKFPKDFEIILALGYKAELVESYCKAVHQDRNITFVCKHFYKLSFIQFVKHGLYSYVCWRVSGLSDTRQRQFGQFLSGFYRLIFAKMGRSP